MKFNGKRLGAIAVSFLFLASVFNAGTALGADSPTKTTNIVSFVVPGLNNLWDAAESVGTEAKFLEAVQVLRESVASAAQLQAIDASKPIEIYVATDENEVFPYARVPLVASVDEASLATLKEKITEKTPDNASELFVEGSSLFVCSSQFKSLVPTNSDSPTIDYEKDALVVVEVDFAAIPREFLEAGFAFVRQRIAEAASADSDVAQEDLEALLTCYSELVDSLERLRYTLRVDSERNLVSTFTVVAKPGGELAGLIAKARDAKTRWNVVANTPNAVFAVAGSSAQSEAIKKFQLNQFKNVTCRNILDKLDVLIDSPEDFEVAKELVQAFEAEGVAQLESGATDVGAAFCADPVLLDVAWTLSKPEEFQKALRKLVDHMIKNDPEVAKYVALETKTVEDFAVSEFNWKIEESNEDAPQYFKGKTLTARLGVGDGAAIVVLGLNAVDVDAEFARIAKGSKEIGAVPQRSTFDFAPLALLIYDVVSSEKDARPVALKTLEKIGESQGVRWISNRRFSENRIDLDFVVEKGFFQTLGEVVRINLRANVGSEDEGEDLDDLFEDEQ